MSDIQFRRIRGRIIPIKKKKESMQSDSLKGSAKIAIGTALGITGSSLASKELKKSFSAFRESSNLRGIARLSEKGSKTFNKFIKLSAKQKIQGMKSAKLARTKFGLALGISTALISSGSSDFFNKDSDVRDEVSGAVGTVAGAGITYLTAKKFKIKATSLTDLFSGFSSRGSMLSRLKINKIAKTAYKGKKPKPGTQFEFDL